MKKNSNKKILINKKMFVEWYFGDEDVQKEMFAKIQKDLKSSDKSIISLYDIIEDTCYIPSSFILNQEILSKKEKDSGTMQGPFSRKLVKFV